MQLRSSVNPIIYIASTLSMSKCQHDDNFNTIMIIYPVSYTPIVDFHHQANYHARHTNKKGSLFRLPNIG